MKLLNKTLSGLMFLSALVVTGCATNQQKEFLDEKNITIERVDSSASHIEKVNVTKSEKGILIRGEIRKHSHNRGPIPGHLDLEIIDEEGESKLISTVKYHRRGHKAKVAKFKVELDIVLEKGDVIRIMHHRA